MAAARCGKSRLTRVGSSTLAKAIAAPISPLPSHSRLVGGCERSAMPSTSISKASPSVRSMPIRCASAGVTGDSSANSISGNEFNSPAAVADSVSCCWICSSNGPTLVSAARRFAATSIMPTINSKGRCNRRRVAAAVEMADETGWGIQSSHQGMQPINSAWRDALIDVNAYVAASGRYLCASVGNNAMPDKRRRQIMTPAGYAPRRTPVAEGVMPNSAAGLASFALADRPGG
ncbi:Uncharacterised protein [Serratia odorifera]|uniref:Uncharacterized protein n=1 Tax=Serratia odorifera TaxID=618 RepID=A0A3S4EB45_SEROD|nr:Uncharacterised protein [Serratia odorifera]